MSFLLALVKSVKHTEKTIVNTAMVPSRPCVLSTTYKTLTEATGSDEAIIVVMSAVKRKR
jgi:hypothetical protein